MQIERTKRTAQPPGGCYVPQNTRKESQKSEGEKCPRTFLFRLRRHNPHATHSPQRFRQYKLAVESHWMPVAKARLHFVAALYIIRHSFLNTRCKKKRKNAYVPPGAPQRITVVKSRKEDAVQGCPSRNLDEVVASAKQVWLVVKNVKVRGLRPAQQTRSPLSRGRSSSRRT